MAPREQQETGDRLDLEDPLVSQDPLGKLGIKA